MILFSPFLFTGHLGAYEPPLPAHSTQLLQTWRAQHLAGLGRLSLDHPMPESLSAQSSTLFLSPLLASISWNPWVKPKHSSLAVIALQNGLPNPFSALPHTISGTEVSTPTFCPNTLTGAILTNLFLISLPSFPTVLRKPIHPKAVSRATFSLSFDFCHWLVLTLHSGDRASLAKTSILHAWQKSRCTAHARLAHDTAPLLPSTSPLLLSTVIESHQASLHLLL